VYLEVAKLNEIRGAPSGLPKLIDFYDEPKYFYIVTDYADGGDLLMTLLRRGKLSEDDAKACAKSLLQGIKYLHSNNICHRNLKPENILLKRARDLSAVIIADFGMATRVVIDSNGKRVRLNERCGTASYMAPEVIQQTPYDTQADMWSVGVILFYALAGALPFEDTSRRALYQKIVKGEYKFNTKDWLGVSKEAKRFISSLLQVDPDVRFTADEALEHSWLENVAVSNFADSPSLSKKKGPKLKGRVWKAMPWKRSSSSSATSEVLVDDSRSTSTVSLVSSDMTNEGRHNRGYSK
jgi:serine/threonine protein kinase